MSKKPVHEIRLGTVKASIWLNEGKDGSTWYGISLVKLYKKGNKWFRSRSFGRDDLPVVSRVADLAFLWVHEQVQSELPADFEEPEEVQELEEVAV